MDEHPKAKGQNWDSGIGSPHPNVSPRHIFDFREREINKQYTNFPAAEHVLFMILRRMSLVKYLQKGYYEPPGRRLLSLLGSASVGSPSRYRWCPSPSPSRAAILIPSRHYGTKRAFSFCSFQLSTSSTLKSCAEIMDEQIRKHYLADSPPTVVKFEVKSHFDNLQNERQRKYAHYMSRCVFTY